MISTLVSLPLLFGAAPGAFATPAVPQEVAQDDAYTALVQSYDAAVRDWRERLKSVEDLSERTKLRASHPATTFAEKFEALTAKGEGRPYLWMIQNMRNLGVARADRAKTALAHYKSLFDKHTAAPWFGEAIDAATKDSKYVDTEALSGFLGGLLANEKATDRVRAHSAFALANRLKKSSDEAQQARAIALLDRIVADFPDTRHALMAQAAKVRPEDLEIGKVAPDFIGSTIDGHEFKLSDYRGKVVLLDFYGFW